MLTPEIHHRLYNSHNNKDNTDTTSHRHLYIRDLYCLCDIVSVVRVGEVMNVKLYICVNVVI